MSDNKFFNDLFNGTLSTREKLEDKNQNDYSRLDEALSKIAYLLEPLQKAIGQGIRQNHKYIKRTGAPGNYQYWYQNPKTGLTYSTDKPHNPAHAGLNADQPENDPYKPEVKTITVASTKTNAGPGWTASSKVPNTLNHPTLGSITIKDNEDGTRSAVHNGQPMKEYGSGKSNFLPNEINQFVRNYISDITKDSTLSNVKKRRIVVKSKE